MITLEISRIVLCIQIVAVAVELPKKYMKKHWISVAILLLPVMTAGWLIVGLFIWVLIPHFNFAEALLVSACVTATDPVLAAAVVGKGKFAERVPGHLRNLLTAESGCNDGMAFPFIFLSLNMVLYPGEAGKIIQHWITLTILWECICGIIVGSCMGWLLRKAVKWAETKKLIDRESFLAFFVFLAFNCAGIGSMLGIDDLLVSFAAGTAFGWNGEFARKTEESHVSTVIDLILNLSFFVYFGAIVPWDDFNNHALGLDVWRLCILAIVVIFLRRIPAVLAFKPFTPDIKTWREALFCGHFGPIGVGAIFAAILARKDLEAHYFNHVETPLEELPLKDTPHYQLIAAIWPMVCFIVVTSIIVHGSSVAVLTLGRHLNRMAITMSFTATNTQGDSGPSWISRLQNLEKHSSSYSLQRVDSMAPQKNLTEGQGSTDSSTTLQPPASSAPPIEQTNTVETSGIKVRPAGGAKRKKRRRRTALGKTLSRSTSRADGENGPERPRPQTEFLQLGRASQLMVPGVGEGRNRDNNEKEDHEELEPSVERTNNINGGGSTSSSNNDEEERVPTTVYQEGTSFIVEDQNGEVLETINSREGANSFDPGLADQRSIHSEDSLRRVLTQLSNGLGASSSDIMSVDQKLNQVKSRTASNKKEFIRTKDRRKIYTYNVGDMLVCENEEGEIVRLYKWNKKNGGDGQQNQATASSSTGAGTKSRSRSSTLVGRAMSLVRGKSNQSNDNSTSLTKSHSSGQSIPPVSPPHIVVSDGDGVTTTNIPMTASPRRQIRRHSTVEEVDDDEDNEPSFDEEEDDDEDASFDSDHETPIERRRRLAALGKLPTLKHEDDEEK
ncbi:uncharacterized protein KQ657_000609 [Scheffersomyces spartinae]|uniref:Na+/H+ antiporter n=1 Tax=Scheffersomyces spartinae TaxID=45513 RepID=A0A9P7V8U2_9ASCO|nr:uncharacterized protein KQ657_000609 [Scheffersomyces spartinae]KAG7193540.1 hypothetical protein KQ657_000609 [Scheffersomyces spartinae]